MQHWTLCVPAHCFITPFLTITTGPVRSNHVGRGEHPTYLFNYVSVFFASLPTTILVKGLHIFKQDHVLEIKKNTHM